MACTSLALLAPCYLLKGPRLIPPAVFRCYGPLIYKIRLDAMNRRELKLKNNNTRGYLSFNMAIDLSRITLRPFKLSDVDDFMLMAGDDRVTCYTRWNTFGSKEKALTYIRDVCMTHPWSRSICIDDRSIGYISVLPGSGDDRCRAEVGYAIAAKYWGKGICTKALKIAVSQVFKDFPDLLRLQAFADIENLASHRVLEKAGFLREGILRKYSYVKGKVKDVAIFSLLLPE